MSATEARVPSLPNCALCPEPTEAHYDANTIFGQWGNLCDAHFAEVGVGLGTGKGQRLVLDKPLTPEKRAA